MMRGYYDGGYAPAAHYNYGWGFPNLLELFVIIFIAVLFIDALLLGFWLWKQLKK